VLTDQRFALTLSLLHLVSQLAHECDRIRSVQAAAQAPQTLRRASGTLPEHDRVVDDADVETIARLDPELPPSLAWHGDLVLGTHLDA
jgi:hypothetical protein